MLTTSVEQMLLTIQVNLEVSRSTKWPGDMLKIMPKTTNTHHLVARGADSRFTGTTLTTMTKQLPTNDVGVLKVTPQGKGEVSLITMVK